MKITVTDKLLDQLNELRGLKYPEIGYSYFVDIMGDGRNIRKIYTIMSKFGGVEKSGLNASTPTQRCAKIRKLIAELTPAVEV